MKAKELVYMVLDEIKSISDDSYFTEDHVMFLLNKYRALLIKQLEEKEKLEAKLGLSEENKQTICLNLQVVLGICGEDCSNTYLKSVLEIPDMIGSSNPTIQLGDYFGSSNIIFISALKMLYVNYNKYLRNLIYCTLSPDNHLYFKSNNPQFLNLENVKLTAVFEDAEKAAEYECDSNSEGSSSDCDPLEKTFPIDTHLVPSLIQYVVKELLGASYRPQDKYNNSSDDLSTLASFIRQNMKSNAQKMIDGDI